MFHFGIRGFSKFIAPYTPRSWSSMWHPPEDICKYVQQLLAAVTFPNDATTQPTALPAHSELEHIWPTIWFWCRTLHELNVWARMFDYEDDDRMRPSQHNKYECQARHVTLLKALKGFAFHDPPTALSVLVNGTDGFASLLAQLWIVEGKHPIWADHGGKKEALCGFQAASLLYSTSGASSRSRILIDQIIADCGGTQAAVEVLFQRARQNLAQSVPCIESFSFDMMLLNTQIINHENEESGDALRVALLTHRQTIPFLVDILRALVMRNRGSGSQTYSATLCLPVITIIAMFNEIDTFGMVAQLLDTQFLAVMAHVVPLCSASKQDDMSKACKDLFHTHFPRYAVFRSLFVRMQRSISKLGGCFDRKYKPGGLAFESALAARKKTYKQFRAGCACSLRCSNPACQRVERARRFRACSSCRLARYCGRACQKEDWRGAHRALCHDMRDLAPARAQTAQLRFTGPAALPGPDARFLTHQVARDFASFLESGDELGPEIAAFLAGAPQRQVLMMNYGGGSGRVLRLDDDMHNKALARNLPLLDQSRAWRGAWARSAPPEMRGYPVLVVLPQGPYPMFMTAGSIAHRRVYA
ncbi:hypothetical protein HWV62_23094 [Athelia sp. TMB]|nr:hypothetical protein HWV62_23094 [Athelia sp. TMB]